MTASDASSRLVLPDSAPYLANLAGLWTIDPALAAAVEAVEPHPVQPSKSGLPTLAVSAGERTVFLHSRYDPLPEARKLIEPVQVERDLTFYVFGCGLGYHIELLFRKAATEALICVFEPDLRMLRTAFEQRDLAELIESRRVLFFTKPDKSDLMARLTGHAALMAVGIRQISHAPSQQIAPEFFAQVRQLLDEFASYSKTSLNTLVLNSRRTAENISRNVGWYVSSPCLSRLKNLHKNKPAIIVAAGPSLRKNKHLLKDAKDRAVLVAVQTTLLPLLELGVEPHYVTTLDYHQISTQFYEKIPRTVRAELIADPKANSAILRAYPGPVSVLGNTFAESLLREMKLSKAKLQDGATVAHLAYYLAEHLGCDPIIFIGQDLGFSDGLCYAPGTSHEDVWRPELSRFCTLEMKHWDVIVRERFILRRIPDFQGRPMYTEERLFTYLQQFERDFANARARIIDATEGGAAKRGATPMPLAEAIAKYCTATLIEQSAAEISPSSGTPGEGWGGGSSENVSPTNPLPNPPPEYRRRGQELEDAVRCLQRRREEARQIEQVSQQTLPLLEDIRDHIDDQLRVNRLIASVDALRARMNELGATYDLVTQLTQHTEFERFKTDRRICASKASGTELQRKQVERDIENVRGVMNAAGDFQKLMDEVIVQLSPTDLQTRSLAA
jgi:hypothetical protein